MTGAVSNSGYAAVLETTDTQDNSRAEKREKKERSNFQIVLGYPLYLQSLY